MRHHSDSPPCSQSVSKFCCLSLSEVFLTVCFVPTAITWICDLSCHTWAAATHTHLESPLHGSQSGLSEIVLGTSSFRPAARAPLWPIRPCRVLPCLLSISSCSISVSHTALIFQSLKYLKSLSAVGLAFAVPSILDAISLDLYVGCLVISQVSAQMFLPQGGLPWPSDHSGLLPCTGVLYLTFFELLLFKIILCNCLFIIHLFQIKCMFFEVRGWVHIVLCCFSRA